MERNSEINVLVLTSDKVDAELINDLSISGKVSFETAKDCNECLMKLETLSFDALIIDTPHLMIGETVNTYYVRTICELAPVIVTGNNQKPEIENEIRA